MTPNLNHYPKHDPLSAACRCGLHKKRIHDGFISDPRSPTARAVRTYVCLVCDVPDPDIELGSE